MHEFAKDLYRLGKELKTGELGGWLTLIASLLIIVMASYQIMQKVVQVALRISQRLLGKQPDKDEYPEGA